MAQPLFQLGSFQFDLPNGVPQSLERSADFRWEGQDRILREPAYQFVGPGSQEITLDGVLYPGFSGRQTTMETLRTMAAEGQPQMFSDGTGRVWGKWCIATLREGLAVFAPGGGARQITFSIRLVRYGEDNPGAAAAPLSVSNISSAAVDPFSGSIDIVNGPQLDASPFAASEWARNLPFNAPDLAGATKRSGITIGQLTGIARAVVNRDYVGAGLKAFGLMGFNPQQSGAWGQMGIDAAQLAQQMLLGRGAPSIAVALEALKPATDQILTTLGASVGGKQALKDLIADAATVRTVLDVDPKITEAVEALIRQ